MHRTPEYAYIEEELFGEWEGLLGSSPGMDAAARGGPGNHGGVLNQDPAGEPESILAKAA